MPEKTFLSIYGLSAAALNIPDVLVNEKNTGRPGVKARLSPLGVNYVARFLTNALLVELINLKLDINPQPLVVDNGAASVVEMQLFLHKPPQILATDLRPPNIVVLDLQEMNISAKATLKGQIFGRALSGSATLTASNIRSQFNFAILKNFQGNPNFRIERCKIKPNSQVQITFDNVPEPLQRPLQESLKRESADLLQGFMCSRADFVVEDRLNTRFGLLAPKITMAALTKDLDEQALIHQVLSKMRAMRQRRKTRKFVSSKFFRERRQTTAFASFNVSRADTLFLDYTIKNIKATKMGLEVEPSAEVSLNGRGGTPFGPVAFELPARAHEDTMLQLVVSDFMPNSLMYHGHTIGLFDTRVDATTPHVGPIMRTSCSLSSGQLFCLGDMFPTLRQLYPGRLLALNFSTIQAPVILFKSQQNGGISLTLFGKIVMLVNKTSEEEQIAEMGIDVDAQMKIRLTSAVVRPRLTFNQIKLRTLSPGVLLQDELDDAVLLAREVLQRLINDILKDGIPIPIHPLFRLHKPSVKLQNRSILINSDFVLNESLMKQLLSTDLMKRSTKA